MAITERYVRSDADGSGDGTTEANSGATGAFTWSQMVTDFNTPARSGYRYNIKQGTYSLGSTTTLTGDGTSSLPIIIRGYKTTIGDATLGRGSDGFLDTSNMPTISYTNSSFRFDASSANFLIVESLNFVGGTSSGGLLLNSGAGSMSINCKVTNNTSGAGYAIENGGNNGNIILGCDAFCPSGGASTEAFSAPGSVVGCFAVLGSSGTGINLRNNASPILFNTIKGGTNGINKNSSGASMFVLFNTILNCSGDGINYASASTQRCTIIGNHITGCGGYGIDLNGTTTDSVIFMNRFRDNVSGNINGSIDWAESTRIFEILTDSSDIIDFVDPDNNNFSLNTSAPAYNKALILRYMNIGANGSQSITNEITSRLHPLAYTGRR